MGKTHVIDGVTYVEVDRQAKDGDYVLGMAGKIRRVKVARENGFLTLADGWGSYSPDYYVVLEPLESEGVTVDTELALVEGTQASEQVIEMLANLARRVTSLERQLADTQRNVERQAEELENAKHRISKHATMFGAVEERVEMLTDDVVTLDERTQVVNAITKFYEEGRR